MKVTGLYFGLIAEDRGIASEEIELPVNSKLQNLREKTEVLIPSIRKVNYSTAVNSVMQTSNIELNEGDEIAFFPPFAGG